MIILASASPRRQQLLSLICDSFSVQPSDIDETIENEIELEKTPEYLALKKARNIQEKGHFDDVVIGCDTGVFLDSCMLGKPKSEEQAAEMLCRLSGRKHKVITGCALIYRDNCVSFSQTTEVEFYELSDKEIHEYISTGEPMDKAGAYGIQGKGAVLVRKIDGDFFNVVGLPVARLKRELDKITEV